MFNWTNELASLPEQQKEDKFVKLVTTEYKDKEGKNQSLLEEVMKMTTDMYKLEWKSICCYLEHEINNNFHL